MSRLEVNGVAYSYIDEGSGPLVVFGHGLLAGKEMFRAQIDALRDRYRCVSMDWPGHGSSSWRPAGWTFDHMVEDTAELVRALGESRAVFVGLSQGGMVFMRLAVRNPEMVRGLVLLDTTASTEDRESLPVYEQLAVAIRDGDEATRSGAVDAAQQVLYGATWRESDPEGLAREKATILEHPRDGGYLAARAVFDRDDFREHVAKISAPTLVLCGEEDTATPPEHSRHLADSIPGARLEMIPGAGHHSPIENPSAVTAHVELFLASLPE
jgi:pimeloyl-ACP methyl ester carboxylesterase